MSLSGERSVVDMLLPLSVECNSFGLTVWKVLAIYTVGCARPNWVRGISQHFLAPVRGCMTVWYEEKSVALSVS